MMQNNETDTAMNVIEVPRGECASVTLSGGTKIWLNAESKLIYPSQFTSKNRNDFSCIPTDKLT
jgi:hypothetical protein